MLQDEAPRSKILARQVLVTILKSPSLKDWFHFEYCCATHLGFMKYDWQSSTLRWMSIARGVQKGDA
jgi:hypothetical protein